MSSEQIELKKSTTPNDAGSKNGGHLDHLDPDESVTCVSHVIGEFGPWQRRFFFYYTLLYVLNVFHNFGNVFYGARSDFWCRDRVNGNMTSSDWDLVRNKCFDDCTGYEIDKSNYHRTIFSEFELVCNRSWLVSIASSSYQIGYLISSLLISYVSDRFGRRPAYKLVNSLDMILCGIQALAPNIYVYLVGQILLGVTAYGRYLTGLLLIMETAGSRKKALLQVSVELFWTVGVFSFLALFFVLPDFRYIKAIACIYEAILLFWVGWIPESIRWLLSKGKYDEARDLLRHACEYNRKNTRSPTKKEVDDDLARVKVEHKIKRLLQHFEDQEVELKEQRKKSLFDLWFSPMAPICLILYICWFTNSLINYGTAYNQSNYGSNLWLSSIMFELSAFSGMVVLFWLIERIDRRWFARFAYFFMFVGCASLTISFYVEGLQRGSMIRQIFSSDPINPVRLVFGMLLKITGNFSYHIIYLLSVESYPTIMRQLGVGTCSVASRFASILAPFLHELGILAGLPTVFMIFTSFSFFALILIGFVPETRGKEIPNTLNECLQRREEAKSKNKTETEIDD